MAEKGMGGREGSVQKVHLEGLANIELETDEEEAKHLEHKATRTW